MLKLPVWNDTAFKHQNKIIDFNVLHVLKSR